MEENKLLAEQSLKRVMDEVEGQKITQTEIRRRQISELLDAGHKPSRIAAIMDCSSEPIYTIMRLKKAGQSLAIKPRTGRPRKRTELIPKVNALRAENPNLSRRALAKKLGVNHSTVDRVLKDDS